MRNPHRSVSRIQHAAETGRRVQDTLAEMVARDPTLLDPVAAILQNQSTTAFAPEGWQNYRPNEDDPDTTAKLLQHMIHEDWAIRSDTWQDLVSHLHSTEITLNKLHQRKI